LVKKQVSVYNWNDDKKYTNRPEWFYDMTHLNENGAITFTKVFCQRLKNAHSQVFVPKSSTTSSEVDLRKRNEKKSVKMKRIIVLQKIYLPRLWE